MQKTIFECKSCLLTKISKTKPSDQGYIKCLYSKKKGCSSDRSPNYMHSQDLASQAR